MVNHKTTHECFGVSCIQTPNRRKRRKKMKRLAIQMFVIGTIIATYALPVLAVGGAGF
jgi:hypothetical protein